jgi:hypothetical protein
MKKLRKLDLDLMERELQVLDYDFTMGIVGGLDPNDCWWRCVAYLQSCGSSYSANDAMALAQAYYGSSFDTNNYAFVGSRQDYANYISQYVVNSGDPYCPGTILIYNPGEIRTGISGSVDHAVIVTGRNGDNILYFDPQKGISGSFNIDLLASGSGAFYYSVQ